MDDNQPKPGNSLPNGIARWAVVALLVAFACALWVVFCVRIPIERQDNTVGILVDYDELKRIADGSQDITFVDMARKAVVAGATGLVVRERILADWENAGSVLVFTGAQLSFHGAFADAADMTLVADKTYILTEDDQIFRQIFSILDAKRRYPEAFLHEDYQGIAVHLSSAERATLGLGFPHAHLEGAAEAGLQIIPRLRNWEPVREDSLAVVFDWIKQIPSLAGIGFNELSVPGGGTNPILQDYIADAIRSLGKPLISFEFYDQAGLAGLAARLDHQLLRAHAIAENELRRYSNVHDAMDRYNLAAVERNIRFIYLRFYGLENPAASLMSNTDLITIVRDGLLDEGLRIGHPQTIPSFRIAYLIRFAMGLGVIAAAGWLLALGTSPFAGKRYWLLFLLLMSAGCAGWAYLLARSPVMAVKLCALAGSIVFPCLGVLLALGSHRMQATEQPGVDQRLDEMVGARSATRMLGRPLCRAICQLLVASAFTWAGSLIVSALLTEPAFMLKLDSFVGVKLAHLIPLGLAPLILWMQEKDGVHLIADAFKSSIRFWQLAVGLIVLAGLVVYILRTGNESLGTVSALELRVRQQLDRILMVRPRTKEFLIGHPVMLIMFTFGYRFSMFPILLIGMIGQISLINTYAHIHTPIVISFLRSIHGMWIGVLLGVAAVFILRWIDRRLQIVSLLSDSGGERNALP